MYIFWISLYYKLSPRVEVTFMDILFVKCNKTGYIYFSYNFYAYKDAYNGYMR